MVKCPAVNRRIGICVDMRYPVVGPRSRGVTAFIPIYPNKLPTVPKPSRTSRTASLVVNNLPASRSATTRLENRCTPEITRLVSRNSRTLSGPAGAIRLT